jgi:Ubiquitin elongating factor core
MASLAGLLHRRHLGFSHVGRHVRLMQGFFTHDEPAASRMVPQTLSKRNIDDILTMMLFVICAPRHYIQNPHIIAKAVEVIHWLCARSEHTFLRQPTEYLFNHRLAQDSLVRALTKLYAGTAIPIIDRGVSHSTV